MSKKSVVDIMEQIEGVQISDALNSRFITYSFMSLQERALPDARDGLKPSQRRILVAMNDLNLTARSATEKCAKICGTTSGDYHPHGEAIIFPTLVRMAQPWVLREPLLLGQGNFGNVDGDPPAAMRYIEAKMSHFGELLVDELSEEVVPFVLNYNEKLREPTILPAQFPNLLVNGAQGIAVGWATTLLPHNYREVVQVVKAYIKNPNITPEEIIKIMPGPDFPTGGKLLGQDGVLEYYKGGRGSIRLEGDWHIEKSTKGVETIVITELPYQSSPEQLALDIESLVKDTKLQGISDLKNLSSKATGIKVVVEVAKGTNAQMVVNNLLKQTSLRTSIGINQTVLIGGKVVPEAGVVRLVKAFVDHRHEVLLNKYNAELRKQNERLHILEALIIVSSRIDEVIKIVRNAQDDKDASVKLIAAKIVTTQIQADAVLAITLRQLTKLEGQKLVEEKVKREERVVWLKNIIAHKDEIDKIISIEQEELSKKYGSERKTRIVGSHTDISNEDLIKSEQLVVSLTGDGYVKSTPVDTFHVQGRGGQGVANGNGRIEDNIFEMFESNSKDTILFFTNKGLLFKRKAYEIPQASRTAKGMHVSNMLNLSENEYVTNMIAVKSIDQKGFLVTATKQGLIKRTELSEYDTSLKNAGLTAIKLNDGDQVAFVVITDGNQDIFIITSNGNCVRYNESIISVQGRATQGCRALKLDGKDSIAQVFTLGKKDQPDILVVTKGGIGKRSASDEYRALANRMVKGYAVINKESLKKNGAVVGAAAITEGDSILVATAKGKVIRMNIADIRATGRTTNGVRVVKLDAGDTVARLTKLKEESEVV